MTKKLFISSLLFFIFSIAGATTVDPEKPVDPEKEQKKNKKVKVLVEKKEAAEEYHLIKGELIPTTDVEPAKKAPAAAEEKPASPSAQTSSEDVQSFNFLYYIIHQFKFSDFITQ